MADRWQTFNVESRGGIIESASVLTQAEDAPGSLIIGQNFEKARGKGYRRINGYAKYSSTALSGSGKVLGCFLFNNGVIGCRGANIEFGSGTTWTSISSTRTGAGRYRGHRYYWVRPTIILVDSVNYPIIYDSTGSSTTLSAAPLGATYATSFKRHMFFTSGQSVIFSAPGDETDYNGASGAGEINVGHEVNALKVFRDSLYVFGPTKIFKITGSTSADFALETVTDSIGCLSPDSIQEIGGDIVFLAQDGIRTIAGTTNIGDVDISNKSYNIRTRINDAVQKSYTADIASVIVPSKSQYRLFWSSEGTDAAECKGALGSLTASGVNLPDLQTEWEWFDILGIKLSCADWIYETSTQKVIHGGYDGYIYEQETANSFDGTAITSILQYAWWHLGDPEIRKSLTKLSMYIRREGNPTITLDNNLDFLQTNLPQPSSITITDQLTPYSVYGTGVYGTATYQSGVFSDETAEVQLVGTCFFNSIKFTSSTLNDAPFTIDGVSVEFGIAGRR